MTSDKLPYDPEPGRGDAFGALARSGYAAVPGGDHAARLARLRARTGGTPQVPVETAVGSDGGGAVVRQLSPKPAPRQLPRRQVWWSAAAAIALLVVASLVYVLGSRPERGGFAKATEAPTDQAAQAPAYEDASAYGDASEARESEQQMDAEAEADMAVGEAYSADRAALREARPLPNAGGPADVVSQAEPSLRIPRVRVPVPTGPTESAAAEQRAAPAPAPAASRTADRAAPPRAQKTLAPPPPPVGGGALRQNQLSDVDAAPDAQVPSAAPAASSPSFYTLERSDRRVESRTLPVRVTGVEGVLKPGAFITIEGTDQRFDLDPDGFVDLQLLPGARVARVVAPERDTVYFDVSGRGELLVTLAPYPTAGRKSSVQEVPSRREVPGLGAVAPAFGAFDSYVRRERGGDGGAGVRAELQFYINKRGRPTGITRSPAFEGSREDYQRAKELLRDGPDWPERYRGGSWRYVVP